MKVKLSKPVLIGTVNREVGEVLDLPEDLAKDVAERGDGAIVVDPSAQVVPPSIGKPLPTVADAPAEDPKPEPESKPSQPRDRKIGPGDAK